MSEKKSERLFAAIGEIDDELLAEAERPIKRSFNFGRLAAIAACLIVTVTAVMIIRPNTGDFIGGSGNNAAPPSEMGPEMNDPPDGGVGDLPTDPGDNDNESSQRPGESYEGDGVTVTVLSGTQNEMRLRITVTEEDAVKGIGFVAERDGVRYVIGYGIDGVSVGRLKIAVDGYDAGERLPEAVGEYEAWVMIGEIADGFEDLDFVLYIDPIGEIR